MNCWGGKTRCLLEPPVELTVRHSVRFCQLVYAWSVDPFCPQLIDNGLHFRVPGQPQAVLVVSLHRSHYSDWLTLLVHYGKLVGQVPSGNPLKVEE